MPITYLHFGPALLLKRVTGNRLNLKTFALTQVLLDMEPGLKIIGLLPEGAGLHTGHTWALGGYMAMAAVVGSWVVRRSRGVTPSAWKSGLSAGLGVVSHLLLDSIYHADVAAGLGLRGLSGVVPQGWLDVGLLLALAVGGGLLIAAAQRLDK